MRGHMEKYTENLTSEESYVFHYYVSCECDISVEEKRFYIQMVRQTQEFMDTKQTMLLEGPSNFKIIFMHFKHDEDNNILFDGAISNGEENRCVDGVIKKKDNKYHVFTYVYRLHQSVPENIKKYYVYDTFKTVKNGLIRTSIYDESLRYRQKHGESIKYKTKIPEIDIGEFVDFKIKVAKNYTL